MPNHTHREYTLRQLCTQGGKWGAVTSCNARQRQSLLQATAAMPIDMIQALWRNGGKS